MMEKKIKLNGKASRKHQEKWKTKFQWNTKSHHYGVLPKGGTKLRISFGGKF